VNDFRCCLICFHAAFNCSIRTTEAASSSFPFFGQYWASSSTLSLSAALSTCPLVNGVRVIVYSLPAGSFSEMIVAVDAASGDDGAHELQAACVPARSCIHPNIDVDIARDVQRVQLPVTIAPSASMNNNGMLYVDIPESKAAADVLAACWANRRHASSGILLHGPAGCGKTAFVRHILAESVIPHEYFDCAAMYAHDGSLFTAAVSSVAKQSRHNPMFAGGDGGAVLVLDHLECMFSPLSPHAQVICKFIFRENSLSADGVFQLHERRAFAFCLAAIDQLMNGGDVIIVGITSTLTNIDQHILHVSYSPCLSVCHHACVARSLY